MSETRPAGGRRSTHSAGAVGSPVFHAKLRPALNPQYLVPRPRLHALLDEATAAPLTLVVAPAGSGKTCLLRSWVTETPMAHAWLSLDEADQDPTQLWCGILAALEELAPGCSERAQPLLRRRDGLMEAVGALLDDLEQTELDPRVLVLDDLQLVDGDDLVAGSLAVFLQHLPAWLRLVVLSRRTPRLPIHRLRARGQLGEVHFTELRFSLEEATALLERLRPGLSPDQVSQTAAWAGGWAASIQLAALAARSDRAQPAAGRRALEVSQVYLEDYVWQEVLVHEPEELVDVLLATSVVARIDPRLAQVLADREDAPELLLLAEEHGLFINRIEPAGVFEVHGLVREVLLALVRRRWPDRFRELHATAAAWYEEQGEVPPALEHWLRAEEGREALRLLTVEVAELYDTGRETTILRTIEAIPPATATTDLEAMTEYAWCHLLVDRRRFLHHVDGAVAWAGRDASTSLLDLARTRVLASIAATIRGDWAAAAQHVDEALRDFGDGWRHDTLGKFTWTMRGRTVALGERWDDADPAVRAVADALSLVPERQLSLEGIRALGEALAGRPVDALRVAAGARVVAETANMTILRAELAAAEALATREIGDPAAVPLLVALAERDVEPVPYVTLLTRLELVQARLDDGNLAAAECQFGRAAELVDTELSGPDARGWLARTGCRLALVAGRVAEARSWAVQVTDPFWAGVCTGRVLLAVEDAAAGDALKGAEPRCPRHQVLRDLLLARAVPDRERADAHRVRAVQQAVSHGLVQTVASEGTGVVEAVERLAWQAPESWVDRLRRAAAPTEASGAEAVLELVETLTERELEVLRLLPSRLTLREIADELFISLNTLKFHLKVIYRKLDCGSRAEASERARALTSLRRTQPSTTRRR